ncbi:hypothetical protein [Mesonia maritima]|uniref:hypothetical protein n=1 Tax=Mesonia maritima TaxID=1793873 RepID=UPI003670A83D
MVIGLLARVIMFVVFYPAASTFPNSGGFYKMASHLVNFSFENYDGKRSPGYPLLMIMGFLRLKLIVIIQFVLGSIGALFQYKILLNLKFNKKTSFCIILLMQSILSVFFYETSILVESFAFFLMTVVLYLITKPKYENNKSYKTEFFIGAILGLMVLVKPFFAYLPFLIYGLFTLKSFSLRNLINKKLILLLFPLLFYFGWSYVNKITTGYFVSTTYLGLNLTQNCVYFAEKAPEEFQWISQPYAKYRDKTIAEERDVAMSIWNAYGEGHVFDKYGLTFPEFTHELGKYAKATIKANPLEYAKQVIFRSWVDFWKPCIRWNPELFRFTWAKKIFMQIWQVQKNILCGLYFVFGAIFLFSCIVAVYKRKITLIFILSTMVVVPSFLQAMVTYGTNSQYSYPFEFMIIFVIALFIKNRGVLPKKNKIIDN